MALSTDCTVTAGDQAFQGPKHCSIASGRSLDCKVAEGFKNSVYAANGARCL